MTYQQAVDYIHSLLKFGIKPGFERINTLLDMLGNPQKKLSFIHVAGTNGKGSTCNMMSNICICSSMKTGLFTSPYVVDFCERIQINGEMISHDDLVKCVEKIKPLVEKATAIGFAPTEFEVITAIAFDYFAEQKCDIVVLEVGLGGRLDSTNVIENPVSTIITSVSYDHMNILGNTIEEIAAEKAGIIKHKVPVTVYVNQNKNALRVIREKAEEMKSLLILPNAEQLEIVSENIDETVFKYNDIEYHIHLIGKHQVFNALSVIEACKQLEKDGLPISEESIKKGIAATTVPARMEVLSKQPLIVIDGGHNADCANALKNVLSHFLKGKKILALCGMMEDKEYMKYIQILSDNFDAMYCATPDNPRSLSAEKLCECAGEFVRECRAFDTIENAVDSALTALDGYDALVICGSFYLACDVRNIILKKYSDK